jgi:hypothetical protein
MGIRMGLEALFVPKTKGWRKSAGPALEEYMHEKEKEQRRALGLDDLVKMAQDEVRPIKHAAE